MAKKPVKKLKSVTLPDTATERTVEATDQIVIGVDFGTTYSGIAYSFAYGDNTNIFVVNEWPGCEGYRQPKVPSNVTYENDGSFKWGSMKQQENTLVCMKLLLDPDQKQIGIDLVGDLKLTLQKTGKSIKETVRDYIRGLYQHGLSVIESKVPKAYLESCQKKFVLTVPAVWSEKAQAVTLEAASEAGISPVSLITEPEAAALYTLYDQKNFGFQIGDTFVICDAGGGTVDLISYEIKAISPRLELSEIVEGNGVMAGSTFVNEKFKKTLEEIIGDQAFSKLKNSKAWEEASNFFDTRAKKDFKGDGDPSEMYLVPFPFAKLPFDTDNRVFGQFWELRSDTLEQIFAPAVHEILKLIDDQVRKIRPKGHGNSLRAQRDIKAIFLVGGFGENQYLKKRIEKSFPDIQVIQPNKAWEAIVKGAVLSQLPQEPVVKSSISKRNWGLRVDQEIDEHLDYAQPRTWDPVDNIFRVNKMVWYIGRGEELERDQPTKITVYSTLDANYRSEDLVFTSCLNVNDSALAPTYPDSSVSEYIKFTSDMSCLPKAKFRKQRGVDGKIYYRIWYNLVLQKVSAGFRFSLEVDGEEMGNVEAAFE